MSHTLSFESDFYLDREPADVKPSSRPVAKDSRYGSLPKLRSRDLSVNDEWRDSRHPLPADEISAALAVVGVLCHCSPSLSNES